MKASTILIVLLLQLPVSFAQQTGRNIYMSTAGKASFVSEAPLELIKASSDQLKGLIDMDKRTFAFNMPTRSFKGFNSPLQQEHFYENYIESDLYPNATFEGKIIEQVDLTEPGDYRLRAKGNLSIHGIADERVIQVRVMAGEDKLVVTAEFDVMLEDHNITVPKMVYQKISEKIRVSVELTFEPAD